MARRALLLSSGLGAVASAMVPLGALLLLDVSDFGAFSLCYLVFAWGWSIELSAICDTWARQRRSTSSPTWTSYASALGQLSVVAAAVAVAVAAPVYQSLPRALLTGLATGAAMYRLGGRFHHAATGRARSVLLSDATSVITFLGLLGILAGTFSSARLDSLLIAWALSGLASSLFYPARGILRGGGVRRWYRNHRRVLAPLLGESLLMDTGSIATPMLISPLLGLADFGIYRSVSSVSLPVQLIVDPIRPNLSQMPARILLGRVATTAVLGSALALGAMTYAALTLLAPLLGAVSPVLRELSAYASAAGTFVFFAFWGYFLYIAARAHVSHANLLRGRALQTVFAVAAPVVGLTVGDLPGAIWGFVAASGTTPLIWALLLRPRHRALA